MQALQSHAGRCAQATQAGVPSQRHSALVLGKNTRPAPTAATLQRENEHTRPRTHLAATVNGCHGSQQEQSPQSLARRSTILAGLCAVGAPLVMPGSSLADGEAVPNLVTYEDPSDKFKIGIPEGWVAGEGAIPTGPNGERRTLAWFPPSGNARNVNVSVTITNVSFEFTSLGSFGRESAFAQNLVNSLDRSYLLREQERTGKPSKEPIQIAKLVDYDSKKGMYFVEYTVQMLPQEPRHLISAVALGNNGRYNRLYTCTAQCNESDLPSQEKTLKKIVNSFQSEVAAKF